MLLSWWRKLAQQSKSGKGHGSRSACHRLGLECLEDRTVPAFVAPASYAAGTAPEMMTVGDFNGDGKLDLVVANATTVPTVSVLPGNGDGTFRAPVSSLLGGAPGSLFLGAQGHTIVAADFNGDGKLDVAVVSGTSAKILLGNGDGTFQAPLSVVLGPNPTRITAADVNGDGHMDLLAANADGTVHVLLGRGDGTFAPAASSVAATDALDVKAVDLNGDGKLDLVVANYATAGTVNVLLGNGDGTFQPLKAYAVSSAPAELVVADFNGDGHMDVGVATSFVTVLAGNGDGTLGLPHNYTVNSQPNDIETGDFNHDGHPDIVVGNGGSGFQIELNNGDGTFGPTQFQFAPNSVYFTAADFNGDGATDFAGATDQSISAGKLAVLVNTNNGLLTLGGTTAFRAAAPTAATAGAPFAMTVTALNASGAVASGYTGTVIFTSTSVLAGQPASYTFTTADAGTHTFHFALTTAGTQSLTVRDTGATTVTGTQTGIVVSPGATVRFLLTTPHVDSAGSFVSTAGVTQNFSATATDSWGNVTAGYRGTVTFASTDAQAVLAAPYTYTAADAGAATFAVTFKTASIESLTVHDSAVFGIVGSEYLFITAGTASTFTVVGGAGAAGALRPVTISARDAYGNFAAGYNGTGHFTSSDAQAVLPVDTVLANGTATVNVRMLTAGTQTLTATDTTTPTLTATETIVVTPVGVAGFDVAGFPATTAGAAQGFTVTVRNTLGQLMTGYIGTVVFTSSDVQAGLPASYTFTAADAGVHRFTATLKTAGTQSLTVADAASAAVAGSQTAIAVTASAVSHFVVTAPANATAGTAFALTVAAVDDFGNVVVGYRGTVHFATSARSAGLPADYTFLAGDNGVRSFNVILNSGGLQSLSLVDVANALLKGNAAVNVTVPGGGGGGGGKGH